MEIKLGEKIRELRRQKNVSQEVLAQAMGVTFQAVSKWETGAAMPDVCLIPALASFFEVSTDELFDYNRLEREDRVFDFASRAAKLRDDKPAEAEAILREGLKQYPGDEILLNNLLYAMRAPERSEEVITLCKALIETARLDDVRYDALRILAETYHECGEQALVKPTLERIPEIYFTKLELMAQLLEGKDAWYGATSQLDLHREGMVEMLARVSAMAKTRGEDDLSKRAAALARTVFDLFKAEPGLGWNDRELRWLDEDIWPLLEA